MRGGDAHMLGVMGQRQPTLEEEDDMTTKAKSWRDQIKIHPAADLFPMMRAVESKATGEDIKKNGLHFRVAVFKLQKHFQPELLDGRNRLDAMEAVGFEIRVDHRDNDFKSNPEVAIWARVSPTDMWFEIRPIELRGDQGVDPYEYVLSVNVHRRHLTPEQNRELIAKLLKAQPEKSNRAIGKQVKKHHETVGAVRNELEATGEIRQLTKTVGEDGKARTTKPAAKKRRDIDDYLAEQKVRVAAKPERRVSPRRFEVPDEVMSDLQDLIGELSDRACDVRAAVDAYNDIVKQVEILATPIADAILQHISGYSKEWDQSECGQQWGAFLDAWSNVCVCEIDDHTDYELEELDLDRLRAHGGDASNMAEEPALADE
jgi:hypothetical protein